MAELKTKIYEMDKLQVAVLRRMAGDEWGMIAVLEPLETDEPARQKALRREWRLTQDMLKLGLVEDVSKDHEESIKEFAEKNNGRQHIVLKITEAGRLMFDYCDDPNCAVHKLGDPMRRYPC